MRLLREAGCRRKRRTLEYRCTSRKTANVILFVTSRIAKANGLLTSDVCEFQEEFHDDREVELPTRSTE
jgi:hypothetical protein